MRQNAIIVIDLAIILNSLRANGKEVRQCQQYTVQLSQSMHPLSDQALYYLLSNFKAIS